jgi:hypothetical protein
MKIKDADEKVPSWYENCRVVLRQILPDRIQGILLLSLVINVALVLLILLSLSMSVVVPAESGKNIAFGLLYKLNIEPRTLVAMRGLQSDTASIPGHVLMGWQARPEHISIDIKNNDFQRLSLQRDKAVSQGIFAGADESIPVTIRYRDEIIKADVNLKGNSLEHWGTDEWSLKVKTRGDSRLFGMREFAIQKPWTRNYLTEWVFHRVLAYEDIPYLQFSFVDVQVNGKEMGIYSVEAAPEDRLLDSTGFPPGPVMHLNDEVWQAESAGYTINDSLATVPVDIYNNKYYNSSQNPKEQSRKALDLFEAFRDRTLTATETFDLRRLATYMALTDLTGNWNGNYISNIRPYYNPVTAKLELIGHDALSLPITDISYLDDKQFNQLISKDPGIVWQYVHELERVSGPEYLDTFFKDIDTEFEQNLSIIYSEFPLYHFPREVYYQNQKVIRETIYPYRCQYSYLENITPQGVVNIESGSAQPMPVEVLGLRINGRLLSPADGPSILAGKKENEAINYQILRFRLPDGGNRVANTDNLTLECRVYGTTPVRSEPVIGRARLSDWPLTEDIVRQQPNSDTYSWLTKDEQNMTLTIQPGKWVISEDLIIPKKYTVLSQPGRGTRLDLTKGAMILSYSPFWLVGDEDVPFEVTSSDNTGQGILLLNVDNVSFLSYVRMSNLSVPDRNGWNLPATVTFYQSPVIIDHSEFLDGAGQGSLLSIIRGSAKISDSIFMRSKSDLLSSAYSSVELTDTRFFGPANSGVTGTGSSIHVRESNFLGPIGIGIRGMRNSDITAGNTCFSTVRVAVAAEDGSEMTLNECTINASVIGLAAYRNTPGYGSGTIFAKNVLVLNTQTPYLSEKGSSVSIGNAIIPVSESNVLPQIENITGIFA